MPAPTYTQLAISSVGISDSGGAAAQGTYSKAQCLLSPLHPAASCKDWTSVGYTRVWFPDSAVGAGGGGVGGGGGGGGMLRPRFGDAGHPDTLQPGSEWRRKQLEQWRSPYSTSEVRPYTSSLYNTNTISCSASEARFFPSKNTLSAQRCMHACNGINR
jgi:hypothetical protein